MSNKYLGVRKRSFVKQRVPMTAQTLYKQSNLEYNHVANTIRLKSLAFPENRGIAVNADAKCSYEDENFILGIGRAELDLTSLANKLHGEESPSRGCTCGFHAYSEYEDARYHKQGIAGYFVLKVVGSGKMFEYKKGYRYGHQRLEEVIVSGCQYYVCDEPADRLIFHNDGEIKPVCRYHFKPQYVPSHNQCMSFQRFGEIASKGLPEGAPRITMRSENAEVIPWEPEDVNENNVDMEPGGFLHRISEDYMPVILVLVGLTGMGIMAAIGTILI